MSGQGDNEGDDGGFIGRWARRKRQATRVPAEPSRDDGEKPIEPAAKADLPELLDEKTLAEKLAALPRIEDIGELTDVKIFMQPWVPDNIRAQALRKLWTVDRAVRDHEIFADYALDYNTPGAAPGYGPLQTTAEMIAQAMRSLSRDPAAEPADERNEASEPAGDSPLPTVASAPPQLAADPGNAIPPAEATPRKPADAATQESAAMREEPDYAAPLPVRRRHGSAKPR